MSKESIIKCPHCDTEYLPGEIFIPKYLTGAPTDIERDIEGKIIYQEGLQPDCDETFICQNCNKKFNIHADINYTSYIIGLDLADTDSDFVSEKYVDRISLKED